MKTLRFYFIASLIWALAGMFLISCSKKDDNAGVQPCQPGQIVVNGQCTGSNYPGGYGYSKYGYAQVKDGSKFRDFVVRYTGVRYYYGGYANNQLQMRVINNTYGATIQLYSPEIYGGSVTLQATKFADSTRAKYEVYMHNPSNYRILEVVFTGGVIDQGNFELRYFTNASNYVVIATGQMGNY